MEKVMIDTSAVYALEPRRRARGSRTNRRRCSPEPAPAILHGKCFGSINEKEGGGGICLTGTGGNWVWRYWQPC